MLVLVTKSLTVKPILCVCCCVVMRGQKRTKKINGLGEYGKSVNFSLHLSVGLGGSCQTIAPSV